MCNNSEIKDNLQLDLWLSLDTQPEWRMSIPSCNRVLVPDFVAASLAKSVPGSEAKHLMVPSENLFKIIALKPNIDFYFHHHAPQFLFISNFFLKHQVGLY